MSFDKEHLASLEKRLGYEFKDKTLLLTALTHASYGDGRRDFEDNERLEFLGDRVLGLLTAGILYKLGHDPEGRMARQLNMLVRKETCADIAIEMGVPPFLRLSRSEDKQGGREKISILGDSCEALLGALYLDGGLDVARHIYQHFWSDRIRQVLDVAVKDAKTALQEMASSQKLSPPVYEMIKRTGPDHRPEFLVEVSIVGYGRATGSGRSKKIAEINAARKLLDLSADSQASISSGVGHSE